MDEIDDMDKLQICNDWLLSNANEINDNNNTIDLFIDIEFQDTICDPQIYLIQFDGNMNSMLMMHLQLNNKMSIKLVSIEFMLQLY